MRIAYKLKVRSIISWFVLINILITVYYFADTLWPGKFFNTENAAVAETKPVEETKTAGGAASHGETQSPTETKSQTEKKAESGTAKNAEKASIPVDTGGDTEKSPLMQPEDIRAIMDTLERKRKALQEDEARIKKERANLDSIKQEIEEKIAELTVVQKKIEDDLSQKAALVSQQEKKMEDAGLQKIKQLVKVYSSMKPKNAAAIVDKMDMEVVFQVFSNMKGEQAGEILSYVNQDRAAKISELLVTKEKTK
jgi:flagellar motility protein MotE (MotC chaperone)